MCRVPCKPRRIRRRPASIGELDLDLALRFRHQRCERSDRGGVLAQQPHHVFMMVRVVVELMGLATVYTVKMPSGAHATESLAPRSVI